MVNGAGSVQERFQNKISSKDAYSWFKARISSIRPFVRTFTTRLLCAKRCSQGLGAGGGRGGCPGGQSAFGRRTRTPSSRLPRVSGRRRFRWIGRVNANVHFWETFHADIHLITVFFSCREAKADREMGLRKRGRRRGKGDPDAGPGGPARSS